MHCKQFKCHSTYSQLDSALTLLPLFISCIMQLIRWGSNGGKGTGGGGRILNGGPAPAPRRWIRHALKSGIDRVFVYEH